MYTQALSALGRESGSANSGSEDEVSRPDYAAMTLKEKEGPGSVRFGSVRFLIRRVPVPTIRFQNWVPVSQDQREIFGNANPTVRKQVVLKPCPSCRSLLENSNGGIESRSV